MAAGAPHRWVEVHVRAAPADVEAVADVLRALAPDGVAITPAIRTLDHDNFAYELTAEPSEVTACVPAPLAHADRRALRRRLDALPLHVPLPPLRYRELQPHDWAVEWRRFYRVQHIGRRIVVRPSWEPYAAQPHEVVLELDPGTAFGTGQHATTRLCLAALETHERPGMRVVDIGTGSGILAIAAALLGAAEVRACDTDPDAVEVARANARRNRVDDQIDLACGSVGETWPWPAYQPTAAVGAGIRPPLPLRERVGVRGAAPADLAVANISSAALIELAPQLADVVRPGGLVVASGYIADSAPAVEAALCAAGLTSIDVMREDEWRCVVAKREAP